MHHSWLHYVVGWMHYIQSVGWAGWFLFIGSYALCCLFFIPGSVLTIAAGAIYGFWGGVAIVLIGNGLGSVLSLLVTRYLFRDWAQRRISRHPKLKAVKNAVARDDWKLVFLTRLSPVMPFSLINYSLGLTDISAWRFLWATELGAVPATCVYVYIGRVMGNLARIAPDLRQHRGTEIAIQLAGLAVAIGVTIYVTILAKRALAREMPGKS